MKIAIVSEFYDPIKGGIENHVKNLIKYVSYYSQNSTITLFTKCIYRENRIDYNGKNKICRIKGFILYIPKGYDVIHLHNFNILPHLIILLYYFFYNLFKKKKVKIVVTPHGGASFDGNDFKLFKRVIKKTYQIFIGDILLKYTANFIICVSETEYTEILKKGVKESKIKLVPNGVDEIAYSKWKSDNYFPLGSRYGKYLLFIGRIEPIKNIEFIIRALNYIEDYNFLIIGPENNPEYKISLEKEIKKLNLEKKVFFIGVKEGKEKYFYIDNSSYCILSSLKESEGIFIKEAISRGKPVIIKRNLISTLGINENVNGFILDHEIDIIKINKVSENVYNKISKNNLLLGKKFRWDNIINKILLIYND